MNNLYSNITGVVMAGGQSSRMGTDKGLLDFNGNLMVLYAIDLLQQFFSTVIISSNNTEYQKFGLKVVPDIYTQCGPMGGIHAVLNQIDTEYAFIISCDMPFMTSNVLTKILSSVPENDIVVPNLNGKIEPLCAVYSKNLLFTIESKIVNKQLKMYDLIKSSKNYQVPISDDKPFRNFNTKEDLNFKK